MKLSNVLLIILMVVLAGFFVLSFRQQADRLDLPPREELPETRSLPRAEPEQPKERSWASPATNIMITNGTKHSIPLDQIISSGTPKDGIPSIDSPRFVSTEKAQEFLVEGDFGIGFEYKGDARFYPFKILVWHEIVNDWVAGEPFAITYHPLTLSTVVFERTVQGQAMEFGVSDRLYNSNLLMYNRTDNSDQETLWLQATGQAVVGPYTGLELKIVPSDNLTFGDWKRQYPDGKVLSEDTGFALDYNRDPYGNYYTRPGLLFPVSYYDDRLPDKAVVLGVQVEGQAKAYPQKDLTQLLIVNDELGGVPIVVWQNPENQVSRALIRQLGDKVLEFDLKNGQPVDKQTNSVWSWKGQALEGELKGEQLTEPRQLISFWFSWAANYPKTKLFQAR